MTQPTTSKQHASFQLGIERFVGDRGLIDDLAGRRIGLIVNPTSVDRRLVPTVDHLLAGQANGDYTVASLFTPEHGLHAALPATQVQPHGYDPRTGLPVWSLYSETRAPTSQMLADVDALLFDLQDVGVRFYTFVWTLYLAMQAAAEEGKSFIVLDRPNPLGSRIDGPLLDPSLSSFVGMLPIPLQHGMTMGELARLFNAEFLDPPVEELAVVTMSGYDGRSMLNHATTPWVAPSPNLPHRQSAWAHAATGVVDGTTASQGVGTTLPFEWVGHSSINDTAAYRLAADLNDRSLPGVRFRPMLAIPAIARCAGDLCGGVQLHIVDPLVYEPARTGIHVLAALFDHSDVTWLRDSDLHSDDVVADTFWIDRLTGDREVRHRLDARDDPDRIVQDWRAALREATDVAARYRGEACEVAATPGSAQQTTRRAPRRWSGVVDN